MGFLVFKKLNTLVQKLIPPWTGKNESRLFLPWFSGQQAFQSMPHLSYQKKLENYVHKYCGPNFDTAALFGAALFQLE